MQLLRFCRKVRFLGQNLKIGYQKFNDLQTAKISKKQLCDRAAAIPDVPPHHLAYIDGYGNLKTTIKQGTLDAPCGTALRVRIGTVEHEAVLSDGSFAVEAGQLAVAPGSSGWPWPAGQETRWMEIFWRGGNAWEAFGRPAIGTCITLRDTV